ncbi:Uncharacterized conserved protein YjdB, contains Ig-like domain [Sarcina sp. DSM 11001]|uniref:Ig-like domain-containing protein n=1 Tax=Sarcina sp. DSM 11001 TaxID=1798184 RepID=UPI00087EA011|nr:Ig-like domain-containing protein [Sarcina sp. DSM 11001]SDL73387.1 Uncharacterized conserved protein YjdB, contains Ig-like domain [Sarcina sp. DSM 11001]
MKKRRILALALALALIMSLVPVSGLAAEPVGFMDPGAVMQEDTEESVNTEAVNGEEALSPDTFGDGEEGSWQDPAGSAEDNDADQALEETPAAEDDGADQVLEETTAVEDDGADQVPEETPAVEDDGADQALEETPAVEDEGADQDLEEEAAVEEENSEPVDEEDAEAVEVSAPDQNEETADAQEAVSEDTQEAAAADIQETAAADTEEAGSVDEPAVPAEDGSAAESAVDEAAVPAEEESLADTSANEVEDGYSYVLMNIPYAEFYAAELAAGSPAVDAVASATKNKPRTGTLAGGSYHVDPEGTDISGVIYPVKASNDDIAALIAYDENLMITDESIIAITVTNRGQETTTWYEGKDALFEAPDHSFYITDDDPAYYKEMSMEADGTMTFGPVQGDAVSVEGVTGAVTIGARHANIEIKLSGTDGVAQGDAVSGAVVTAADDEGNATQYGLRHVVNIWRGTEIGWNYDELDIYGKTITNIRYYKQDAVIDYPVDIPVRAQYVLMNIPYADFYAAELKAGSAAVDAVASATKSKPLNARLAGGSYHVNADGSDISGVIYPVKVNSPEDLAKLEEKGAAVITDDSSVDVSVPGRNGADPTITVYNGKDALFQAPDYSYYDLGSGIQSFYKELTVAEDGSLSFGAVKGTTTRAEAEVSVTANASHTYYEMKVTSDYVQTGDTVSAVVMTAEDGTTYGLRHMANLWRGTEIGFEADETFSALIGKKITGLKFITQNGIYNFTVDALIPEKLPEYVLMNIPYADFYAAELAQGSLAVDAVASATMSKPRSSLANGSYHVNVDGSDISGVVYPVKVGKGFQLDPAKQVTDADSLSITVMLRGQETTTEYTGRNALFEAPDYSWYALSAEEVPAFFKEVRSNHGNTSFGAAVGEILTAQATAEVKAKGRHADYEIKLTPDEGVLDQATDVVNAVVLTDSEGNTYGLRHVVNIWRVLEVGFNRDEPAGALAGKKITNIRYFKQNGILDLTVDIDVPVLSTAVTLDKTSVSLLAGKTAALAATVNPEQAGQAVTWTSSDENVVTVDENGVLTAVAAGTATVTAAAADNTGASAVCEVTVTKPVSSIKLDKTSASILRGKTVTLKATVSPDDAANKAVTWSSSDKKIATVDAKGVVTGVAKGTATITAKAKDGSGVKATCKITVKQPFTKITLSKTSASILRNKTITLKATAGPSSANDKSVAWTTSNKKVATVDSKGVVKGIAKGTATITATARDGSKVKATCKITVKQPVTKITLNKTSASILRNKTITLKATAGPSSANDKSVTWTTSNKKVATVNSKGVVKGIAKGTATITATAKDGSKVKAVCKITVKQPVTKLTINKTKLTVKKGKTATLKVTVAPSSANDKSLKWTTSNKNIATVTQKGVVKGIKTGTVTITAAARDGSGKKVTCKITVQ